ncbi:hypothetical protein FOZ63_002872, partial [Perkinsus olseni]
EVKTSKSGEPSSVPMTTTVERFVFAEPAPAEVSGTWSVREVLQNTDANLAKHPKDRRKYLLSQLRAQGLDIRFSCAADLCAIIQVLNAKLELTDEEKRVLRRQLITELQKRQLETAE